MKVDYEIKVGKGINCHFGRQEVGRCRTWVKSEESIIWSGWSRQVGRSSWLKTQGSFYQKSKTGWWSQEEGGSTRHTPGKILPTNRFCPQTKGCCPTSGKSCVRHWQGYQCFTKLDKTRSKWILQRPTTVRTKGHTERYHKKGNFMSPKFEFENGH